MVDRIQKVLQYKKLTASKFADMVGVPRSTISHIISGRNNPSLEFLQKILDTFPEIRTEWLIRGEGSMIAAQSTLFPDDTFDGSTIIPSPDHVKMVSPLPGTARSDAGADTIDSPSSSRDAIDSDADITSSLKRTDDGVQPSSKVDAMQAGQPEQSAQTTQSAQSAQSAQPAQSEQSSQSAHSAQSAQSAQSEQSSQSAQSAQSAQGSQSGESSPSVLPVKKTARILVIYTDGTFSEYLPS